ncbi:histidine phosphatase family protein [Psychrobacter arenosus]|uniref:histidine phosphatase family protein n=1 Tax=Psychrobacter arenosus TaxID=256326 RepID=UPI00191B7EDA|nr:histidine phosphatase family protein [Psychrobacter arenosus]
MKSLYIVRHGQSLANTGAESMPDKTIPLTALGIEQATTLCANWQALLPKPSTIYCSQMLRAQQTAQIFCEHHQIEAQALPLLNEFGCLGFTTVKGLKGEARGKLAQQYWVSADLNYRDTEDSDSFADFVERVDGFIDTAASYEHHSVFFGHGIWLGLLAWRLLGIDIQDNTDMRRFRQFQTAMPMYNTVVYRLDISDDGVMQLQAVRIN